MKMIGDRVLVKRMAVDEVTQGGIIIPDKAKDLTHKGEVLEVGPGEFHNDHVWPPEVSVGDMVIFPVGAGHSVKVNGQECIIMREQEILGVIHE